MARNRKRAKERRARRPEPVVSARREREDSAPAPIAHAAPDVELAEAQLALGRDPEVEAEAQLALERDPELEADSEPLLGDEDRAQNGELDEADAIELGPGSGRGGGGAGTALTAGRAGEPAHPPAEPHVNIFSRLIGFLQGCWRELQRVQWPDRRQVMQATGVVIGFVIVAGVFLGVADYVAEQIVKFILK